MSILERIGKMLESEGDLERADALVVLDGGEFRLRLAAALDLLRRGYAPRLIVSLCNYHRAQHRPAEEAAREWPDSIILLRSSAVSTREEAAEARVVLERLKCKTIIVVTSWYHTRRARTIFARALRDTKIKVGACPVAVPTPSRTSWFESGQGRGVILLEAVKLFATYLRLGLPGPSGLRVRFKEWLQPRPAPAMVRLVPAWVGPQERLTSDLQGYLWHSQVSRKLLDSQAEQVASRISGQQGFGNIFRFAGSESTENGAGAMEEKTFKAVTVTAKENAGHSALAEAFNAWADKQRPASIVHVHYYHDQRTRTRGYQIIFEESIRAEERPISEEERRAA
jgi:uncharacterized SAM-binding protein YcdF (DUF218 family)